MEHCSVDKTFVYNNAFKVIKGKKYFNDGLLVFDTMRGPKTASEERESLTWKRDGNYRTVGGPTLCKDGVILANSDYNLAMGLQRLTCKRDPDNPGMEEMLTQNQITFYANETHTTKLRKLYSHHFDHYIDTLHEMIEHYADPHAKKDLRIQAKGELEAFGKLLDDLWFIRNLTRYKCKTNEYSKFGKFVRLIADLGVAASLQGFVVMEIMKSAMEHETFHASDRSYARFIKKPSYHVLKEVFNELVDPSLDMVFFYHSDDSCIAIRIGNVVYIFNIDISSCDASHKQCHFDGFCKIFPDGEPRKSVEILVKQCQQQFDVFNPYKHSESVRLEPEEAKLFSGSTLTTGINNSACVSAYVKMDEHKFTDANGIEGIKQQIIDCWRAVGYIVTIDTCHITEDIQFLKHSPVFDTNHIMQPMKNIGVLLRAYGEAKGDYPGRGPLGPRIRMFNAAIINGMYNNVSFPLLNNLIKNTLTPTKQMEKRIQKEMMYKNMEDTEFFEVRSHDLYKRYRLTEIEILELDLIFGCMDIEQSIALTGGNKILEKDYGLHSKPLL